MVTEKRRRMIEVTLNDHAADDILKRRPDCLETFEFCLERSVKGHLGVRNFREVSDVLVMGVYVHEIRPERHEFLGLKHCIFEEAIVAGLVKHRIEALGEQKQFEEVD